MPQYPPGFFARYCCPQCRKRTTVPAIADHFGECRPPSERKAQHLRDSGLRADSAQRSSAPPRKSKPKSKQRKTKSRKKGKKARKKTRNNDQAERATKPRSTDPTSPRFSPNDDGAGGVHARYGRDRTVSAEERAWVTSSGEAAERSRSRDRGPGQFSDGGSDGSRFIDGYVRYGGAYGSTPSFEDMGEESDP